LENSGNLNSQKPTNSENFKNSYFDNSKMEKTENPQIKLENIEENVQENVEKEYFLWFGNEITGLESQILAELDAVLHLPMKGYKESLNIASCLCACGYLFDFAVNNSNSK